jgi:Poxvirus A32 protein
MEGPVEIPTPQKKEKEAPLKIFKNLPQLPFTCLIVGPRHRGKTYLLKNMLGKKKGMYGGFFAPENIILYSPTYDFDKTLHDLKLKNVYSPPQPMKEVYNEIMEQQEKFREEDNMDEVLIVMEDITQIKNAWDVLENLGYTGRHFHIHTLAIAHKMSSIPRGVRTQTTQWILFEPMEQSEWEWILSMFSRRTTQAIWIDALRRCWAKPYNFVYIDFERKDFDEIYRSGFNEPLFTLNEKNEMLGGSTQKRKLPDSAVYYKADPKIPKVDKSLLK